MQAGSEPSQWRHVPSESNPADIASRGVTPEQLLEKDQWFDGPGFLWVCESQWPPLPDQISVSENEEEMLRSHRVKSMVTIAIIEQSESLQNLLLRCSCFYQLVRGIA